MALAGVLAAVALVGVALAHRRTAPGADDPAREAATAERGSVVLLPLFVRDADSEKAWLRNGLAEMMRAQLGPKHRPLLLASALFGAALLVSADALCRLAFQWVDTELPVGVLTAFIGAPYFIAALRSR